MIKIGMFWYGPCDKDPRCKPPGLANCMSSHSCDLHSQNNSHYRHGAGECLCTATKKRADNHAYDFLRLLLLLLHIHTWTAPVCALESKYLIIGFPESNTNPVIAFQIKHVRVLGFKSHSDSGIPDLRPK